ncbi:HAD-IB family hydrolase [Psychrobacter sp. I-STPA10]|uniref:HAD-IB family hydrolase n=1 Tax=Psychrobacter sp. I-STPA10 TaxID=2585769 RepID=UPI001E3DEAF2|nr:HAD-IB family hydrolase [Psychrobacter sp. I-STPA10]
MSDKYAFFDFDGTLTKKDSLLFFLRYLINNDILFLIKIFLLSPILIGYFLKIIPNYTAKEKLISSFVKDKKINWLYDKSIFFSEKLVVKILRKEGIEKLRYHQKKGYICVLVSASLEVYLQPWAEKQGFDYVIGTKLQTKDGLLTGNFVGNNCFGDEKVYRIENRFGRDCWIDSFVYTDSLADLPILKKSSYPFILHKGFFIKFNDTHTKVSDR